MVRRWLKLKRHGVRAPRSVIAEAKRANLDLADAVTMLEQETGIPQQNIFGCDHGDVGDRPPYCHQAVTRERIQRWWPIHQSQMNGVGWTQITWYTYVEEAQRLGGAHKVKYQMRVGFKALADLIRAYGVQDGHRRYNGSGAAAEAYGRRAVDLRRKWQQILS